MKPRRLTTNSLLRPLFLCPGRIESPVIEGRKGGIEGYRERRERCENKRKGEGEEGRQAVGVKGTKEGWKGGRKEKG